MIAVIFEVWPKADAKDQYLHQAGLLKAELEKIDGFISVERFESITESGKMLSLSFFKDEEAVEQWRNLTVHRSAQKLGRNSYFDNYRLRVCSVLRDYGMTDRQQVPADSARVNNERG